MIYIILTIAVMIIAIVPNNIKARYVDNDTSRLRLSMGVFPYYISFVAIFLIFTLTAGLRYFVGTDYKTYITHQIPLVIFGGQDANHAVELLYAELIKYSIKFGGVQSVFIATHVIIMLFLISYVKNRSSNYMWSFYILVMSSFFNFSLNGMRQAIGTAIFLYATQFISKRKVVPYLLLITVAVLFHKSAMLYYPFYLLTYVHIEKFKNIYWIIPTTFFVALNARFFYKLMYSFSTKYNFYSKFFGSSYDNNSSFNNMYILILFLNILVTVIYYMTVHNNKIHGKLFDGEPISTALQIDINIQLLGTLFSAISFVIPGAFRTLYMFLPIQITLIPNLLANIQNRYKRLLVEILLACVYLFIFCYLILYLNQNETLPYHFVSN